MRESEEKEADGDFARCERDEELRRVEVVVFEEVAVLFYGEVLPGLAEPVADFCYYEAFAYGCYHLCF